MTRNAILVNYAFCTGCSTCETSCKMEKGIPVGKWAVKLQQVGPFPIDDAKEKWVYDFFPAFTDMCDLCAERTAAGKLPACVHSCESRVMEYGPVEELAKKMAENPTKCMLYTQSL